MPILVYTGMGVKFEASMSSFSCFSACFMRTAARQARFAWSLRSMGAPKNETMASPIYLSIVPFCSSTISLIKVRYRFRISTRCSGVTFSERVEKLFMSVNRAVMCFSWPPSFIV